MDEPGRARRLLPPRLADLAGLCRALNEAEARYVLVGGLAVRAHGGERTTKDVDLLIDPAPENLARIETAFLVLRYISAGEAANTDAATERGAVPVWDVVVVDIITEANGVTWEAARTDIVDVEVGGVNVPVVGIRTLLASKQFFRPGRNYDEMDARFLQSLLDGHSGRP